MKKYIYLIASFAALTFTACDPMEEVYDELDEINNDAYTPEVTVELATKDYELLKNKAGVPANVYTDYFFASEAEAAEIIPQILNLKYPQFDNGASVEVTYNQKVYSFDNNVVSSTTEYTVTADDYDAVGMRFDNFTAAGDLIKFLNYKYPAAAEDQLVILTFDYYTGVTETRKDAFVFKNGAWIDAYYVSPADYAAVDRGQYDNFTSADDEMLAAYFDKFLRDNIVGAKTGDIQYVYYVYYSGSTQKKIYTMMFDGAKWVGVTSNVIAAKTIQFAKANDTWKPDLTIRYTLTSADYITISTIETVGTADNRSNLAKYGNFYQGSTTSTSYWSPAQVIEALGALLKQKYPQAEEGQKFQVTYTVYNSGAKDLTTTLQLENGEYKEL